MIDLHTHTVFSDGQLTPAELVRQAEVLGLQGVALTDHADMSSLDFIVPRVRAFCDQANQHQRIRALAGIELTYLPPPLIADLTVRARELGAQIVLVHGETITEPVPEGTNLAAIEAGVDLLAHPGLLTEEQARLAAERGVLLELSARQGHCLCNGRVARLALAAGARLVVDTDTHSLGDLIDPEQALRVALGAGLDPEQARAALDNGRAFLQRALG